VTTVNYLPQTVRAIYYRRMSTRTWVVWLSPYSVVVWDLFGDNQKGIYDNFWVNYWVQEVEERWVY